MMRAAESTTLRIHQHLNGTGLTISQFGVLEALHHLGPLSQRDLGNRILKTSGNMTMVIDNLEKRRLVRRRRNREDRRIFNVHLTDRGRSLMRRLFPKHARTIRQEMGVLTVREQNDLARLCRKLSYGVSATQGKGKP